MPKRPKEQAPAKPAEHQEPSVRAERTHAYTRVAVRVMLRLIIEYILSQLS